jgi:hypothetical protein
MPLRMLSKQKDPVTQPQQYCNSQLLYWGSTISNYERCCEIIYETSPLTNQRIKHTMFNCRVEAKRWGVDWVIVTRSKQVRERGGRNGKGELPGSILTLQVQYPITSTLSRSVVLARAFRACLGVLQPPNTPLHGKCHAMSGANRSFLDDPRLL